MTTNSVVHSDAMSFIGSLENGSVQLVATDPPYMGIVEDHWDNQWASTEAYVDWMYALFKTLKPKMKSNASLLFFGGIGKHGLRPFFSLLDKIESTNLFTGRNLITWSKRRAYGKSHDYLFCREEIAWYSVSSERTEVVFNIPLTDVKRGYPGWDEKHPAKSEFKRVTNVWTDIPELMRPERNTQKPIPLMERIIRTHSNEGDLVVDMFCGWGTTGVAARRLGREFCGCEAIEADAIRADERVRQTVRFSDAMVAASEIVQADSMPAVCPMCNGRPEEGDPQGGVPCRECTTTPPVTPILDDGPVSPSVSSVRRAQWLAAVAVAVAEATPAIQSVGLGSLERREREAAPKKKRGRPRKVLAVVAPPVSTATTSAPSATPLPEPKLWLDSLRTLAKQSAASGIKIESLTLLGKWLANPIGPPDYRMLTALRTVSIQARAAGVDIGGVSSLGKWLREQTTQNEQAAQ